MHASRERKGWHETEWWGGNHMHCVPVGGGGGRQAGKQRRKQDLPTPATAVPERERQTPDNHCKFEGQAGLHSRTV